MKLKDHVMSLISSSGSNQETKEAVELFKADHRAGLAKLIKDARQSVSDAIHNLLEAEITLFLGSGAQVGNKRNGYHPIRTYTIKGLGSIEVKVPKDRNGRFKSAIVPRYQRTDDRLKADMAVLHLAGLSTRTLAMISKRLLGTKVNKDTVTSSLDTIKGEAEQWLERSLSERYWALFVDGTFFNVQRSGTTEKEPSLVVMGVDEGNHFSILAITPGSKDKASCWKMVFNDLKRRGLSAEHVRIGIMDGLPGLEKVFHEEFPCARPARCWRHASENIMNKVPNRLTDAFKPLLEGVMYAESEADSRAAYRTLKDTMERDAGRAVACLTKDLDSLLVHYSFPKQFWRALRTTNPIERVNKEFKRRYRAMGSLGEPTLRAVLAFTALRLEMGWASKPIDSKAIENLTYVRPNVIEKTVDQLKIDG